MINNSNPFRQGSDGLDCENSGTNYKKRKDKKQYDYQQN